MGAQRKDRGWRITCEGNKLDIYGVESSIPSPVRDEAEPDWAIYLHARERDGKTFLSVSMNAGERQVAESLALFLVPWLRMSKINAKDWGKRFVKALEACQRGVRPISEK